MVIIYRRRVIDLIAAVHDYVAMLQGLKKTKVCRVIANAKRRVLKLSTIINGQI